MADTKRTIRESKGKLWTGIVLTALVALFLVFDGVTKLMQAPQVIQASARLGLPLSVVPLIGAILLLCTALYLIPRTAVLGAVLLTGYLGGAVAIQIRVGSPAFETCFPILFGVLVWAGISLRETRILFLMPFRSKGSLP